jgi:hypothetical protein
MTKKTSNSKKSEVLTEKNKRRSFLNRIEKQLEVYALGLKSDKRRLVASKDSDLPIAPPWTHFS